MDFDHLNHFISHDNGDDSGFIDPQDLMLDEPWTAEADAAGDGLQAANYIDTLPTLDGPSNHARQKSTVSPSTRPPPPSYRVQKPHVPTSRPWQASASLPQRQTANPRPFFPAKQFTAAQRRPVGRVARHALPGDSRPFAVPERSRAAFKVPQHCAHCRPLEEAASALKADFIAF